MSLTISALKTKQAWSIIGLGLFVMVNCLPFTFSESNLNAFLLSSNDQQHLEREQNLKNNSTELTTKLQDDIINS